MKYVLASLACFLVMYVNAQTITLSMAVSKNENNDKFLYRINPEKQNAEYLGEIEVEGFSNDDKEVFSKIYKKAKMLGANAFALKNQETIDGKSKVFSPHHYCLNLFYATSFPQEDNVVYIFSSNKKGHAIKIDEKKIRLKPRSYIKKIITQGVENYVASGYFLGSRINFSPKEGQKAQYFQITSFSVKADDQNKGGLNIKSGDIRSLDKSYADFLSLIYEQQKENLL